MSSRALAAAVTDRAGEADGALDEALGGWRRSVPALVVVPAIKSLLVISLILARPCSCHGSVVKAIEKQIFAPSPGIASASPALPGRSKGSDSEVWALALAFGGDLDAVAGAAGVKFDGGGVALGRGWRVADDLTLGVLGTYTETDARTAGGASGTDIESRQVGTYATWSSGRWYADGQAAYTFSDHKGRRVISAVGLPSAVASSNRDGDQLGLFVESGRSFHWKTVDVVPHSTLQYQHLTEDAYTETGARALNLTVGRTRIDSFQTALGVRLEEPRESARQGHLSPQVTLRWAHEHGDLSRDANASFVGTAQSFRVNGRSAARDRLQVQSGVVGQLHGGVELELAYAGELASGENIHAGFARAVWRW